MDSTGGRAQNPHALGGKVDYNPKGIEFGTALIHLTRQAHSDPLFSELPVEVSFQVSHSQSALELPPGAELLAFNEVEPHHGFRYGDRVWGVQFHPEFDADLMRRHLIAVADRLRAAGKNVEALIRDCTESPHGSALLRQFISIVRKCQDDAAAS
ncbi:MAG: glutamine amidotransferase-related protein [Candidatus Zhuqueibacterota bacterium]